MGRGRPSLRVKDGGTSWKFEDWSSWRQNWKFKHIFASIAYLRKCCKMSYFFQKWGQDWRKTLKLCLSNDAGAGGGGGAKIFGQGQISSSCRGKVSTQWGNTPSPGNVCIVWCSKSVFIQFKVKPYTTSNLENLQHHGFCSKEPSTYYVIKIQRNPMVILRMREITLVCKC